MVLFFIQLPTTRFFFYTLLFYFTLIVRLLFLFYILKISSFFYLTKYKNTLQCFIPKQIINISKNFIIMARMNLFNSSCQADDICTIYCKAQANIYLNCKNASLVRLKTASGHEHIVWMDNSLANQGIYSYARAFYEPQEWQDDDLGDVKYRIFIQPNKDVFCYNGNTYFLYAAQNKNFQIRRLKRIAHRRW